MDIGNFLQLPPPGSTETDSNILLYRSENSISVIHLGTQVNLIFLDGTLCAKSRGGIHFLCSLTFEQDCVVTQT